TNGAVSRMTMRKIFAILGALAALSNIAYAQSSKPALDALTITSFPNQTNGAVTPLVMQSYMDAVIASFQQYAGVNALIAASYTIQASDYGQLVTFNNSGAVAVTLPQA